MCALWESGAVAFVVTVTTYGDEGVDVKFLALCKETRPCREVLQAWLLTLRCPILLMYLRPAPYYPKPTDTLRTWNLSYETLIIPQRTRKVMLHLCNVHGVTDFNKVLKLLSFTAVTPSVPTICLAGGLSCPPIAVNACTVSAINALFTVDGSGAYSDVTVSELSRSPIVGSPINASGLVVDSLSGDLASKPGRGFSMRSNLSRRPENISRASGAGFSSWRYSAIGGTDVILLVRTLTSMLACTIDILTLKGAISYARLCVLLVKDHGQVCNTSYVTISFYCPL
jgi:hypothetical protein